jgi:capsular polysaccharide export protein
MSSRLSLPGQARTAQATELENWREPVLMNPAFACLARAKRVLLLQGPVGPFYDRLSQWLMDRGTKVRRVAFQGGDEKDCQLYQPDRFCGTLAEWPAHLASLIGTWSPDCIVLFGQSRRYHKTALERARAIDLPVVVMEEGYFRPGFVTMELGGVNGYSTTLDRFVWRGDDGAAPPPSEAIGPEISPMHFQKMAWHASQHYVALHENRHRFPHYEHHRCADPYFYARYWTRSWFRKGWHKRRDRRFQDWLFASGHPYYFVPLQVEGDSQITQHSPFASNVEFLLKVLRSFAAHAPAEALLVFRQHPHSRGGRGHHDFIRNLAKALGVESRVHHMSEGDTPDLAQHSQGTVVINSTVGLQALERGVPLIAMGDSLYKRHEFTFMGELDDFWTRRLRPDPVVTSAFLAQVKNLTQAPASVYALRTEPLNWRDVKP